METTFQEQLDWLDEAREAVFCWDYDRPGMDSRFPGGSRLPRTGLLDRAMAVRSSSTRRRRSPVSAGPAPTLECAFDACAVLPRFSPGHRWASSLSHSLPCPILRSGLGLPTAARLALGPPDRRKPAARTLTLARRGRLSTCLAHAALERPCTRLRFVLPAAGFGRCRQSRVSGKRSQTLNA